MDRPAALASPTIIERKETMTAPNRPGGKSDKGRVDLQALKASVDLLALARSRGHEPAKQGSQPDHYARQGTLAVFRLWQGRERH